MTHCKVCKSDSRPIFKAKILEKYDVQYYQCTDCGFIQTETPFWLAEAYSEAINDIDLGPVNRALTSASVVEDVILSHFDEKGRFLDFGAGYGVFVRLMRDRGYDFSWFDAHCENLFAKHFLYDSSVSYDLITSFEVFEHLDDVIGELDKILSIGRNVLFSTLLIPDGVKSPQDWWYFSLEHGQHISFFTRPALEKLAARFNLNLVSDDVGFHMFSERPMSEARFKKIVHGGYRQTLIRKIKRRRRHIRSLLESDFQAVSGMSLS